MRLPCILSHLATVLPEYMVPSLLVKLEAMPLSVNGKLDRGALPEPELVNEDSYLAPTTELEETLCGMFAEVLGLERFGISDDFFSMGGNSILAIRLANKLSKVLDTKISVADIFSSRRVNKIKELISNNSLLNVLNGIILN